MTATDGEPHPELTHIREELEGLIPQFESTQNEVTAAQARMNDAMEKRVTDADLLQRWTDLLRREHAYHEVFAQFMEKVAQGLICVLGKG